jgi:hypothetical protein
MYLFPETNAKFLLLTQQKQRPIFSEEHIKVKSPSLQILGQILKDEHFVFLG